MSWWDYVVGRLVYELVVPLAVVAICFGLVFLCGLASVGWDEMRRGRRRRRG